MGDDSAMSVVAEQLQGAALDEVIEVLGDAFAGYPVMRFVAGATGDVAARELRLVALFVTRRYRRGAPLLGIRDPDTGALVGAAAMTRPSEPAPSPDLAAWVEAVWQELGGDARLRYEQYAATWPQLDPRPHHHLNMIGIRRSHAGRGLARPLLEAVHAMADADPESAGVSLTTEFAPNVGFYQHFGYRVVGHKTVVPGFDSWGFFREK
jgi:GNAT superfamily N-acetyltransferase